MSRSMNCLMFVGAIVLGAAPHLAGQPLAGPIEAADSRTGDHALLSPNNDVHTFECRLLTPPLASRGAHAVNLWPNGLVPYEFDPPHMADAARSYFFDGVAWIEQVCSVRFVPRTTEADYIVVRESGGTIESYVGRIGGPQIVAAVSTQEETVVHALMHTLGFWHEFQRPDRDQYIQITPSLLPEDVRPGYEIVPEAVMHGPYDFNSIMHRRLSWHRAFFPKPPYDQRWTDVPALAFGQGKHFSRGDILTLRALYGADSEPCVTTSSAERIIAPDPQEDANFGGRIAFWQDWMFVSAVDFDWGTWNGPWGKVYAYQRVGAEWVLRQELAPPPEVWARFGSTIIADAGWLVVTGRVSGSVRLHVYQQVGASSEEEWTLTSTILASTVEAAGSFGEGLDIEGSTLVAGSPTDRTIGGDAGSVTILEHDGTGWVEVDRLFPDTSPLGGNFGASVSIAGDLLAVGMPGDEITCIGVQGDCGSVYIYRRYAGAGWQLEQQLFLDGTAEQRFGEDVAIHGDDLFVGSLSGVHHYEHADGAWTQRQELRPSDFNQRDLYGWSLDYDGLTVAVGAPYDDDLGTGSGAAYAFQRTPTGWKEVAKCLAPGGWPLTALGAYVAIDGENLAVSSPGDPAGGPFLSSKGALYLYRGFDDCDANGITDLCDIAAGAADLDADGVIDGCDTAVCPADVTLDSRVDVWDLLRYLEYWFQRDALAERTGDLVPNVNEWDLLEYVDAWFTDRSAACAG